MMVFIIGDNYITYVYLRNRNVRCKCNPYRSRPRLRSGRGVTEVFSASTVIGVMLDNPRIIRSKLVARLHFCPDSARFAPITQKSNEILFYIGRWLVVMVFWASFNFQSVPLRRCVERSEGTTG